MINVPLSAHEKLIDTDVRATVPLFEFPAKNIGIRRARGEFVISTNADLIFSPEIFSFFSKRKLKKTGYYRANRYDFNAIENYDLEKPGRLLVQIRKNVFAIHLKGWGYQLNGRRSYRAQLLFYKIFNRLRLFYDLNLLKFDNYCRRKGFFDSHTLYKYGVEVILQNGWHVALSYHTNASGDFMLMHRHHWHKLRGYPENTYLNLHTDAIFTIAAAVKGLKENVVPWPIFHQDHGRVLEYDDKKNQDARDMLEKLVNDGNKMEKEKKPIIYNDENWGWGSDEFDEEIF